MTPTETHKGIVLFAHGSRDPVWHQPINAIAALIRHDHPDLPVQCAYLELTTPDLPTACNELLTASCNHITIVPLFLGQGRHAREDLPALVEALRLAHPTVIFTLRPSIGEEPEVLALLARLASQGHRSAQ